MVEQNSSQIPSDNQTSEPKLTTKPDENKLFGVFCYLGFLVLVPLFMKKDDSFIKFHLKQGLVLLIGEVLTSFLNMIIGSSLGLLFFRWLITLLWVFWLVMSVVGIINVIQNKEKPLPLLGSLGHWFKI